MGLRKLNKVIVGEENKVILKIDDIISTVYFNKPRPLVLAGLLMVKIGLKLIMAVNFV